MWDKWEVHGKPDLKGASMIITLTTSMPQYLMLYSQGRELAEYLKNHLHVKHFATYYSDSMPPDCLIRSDGTAGLYSCEFHYFEGRTGKRIILLSGESSPQTEMYWFADRVLSFARDLGVKEMFSIGTRWTESPTIEMKPQVLGFGSDADAVDRLRRNGVRILSDEQAPYFGSLVVGMSKLYGITGYKLSVNHGEPRPHPRSVKALLQVLFSLLDFMIDTTELDQKARQMDATIKEIGERIQQSTVSENGRSMYA